MKTLKQFLTEITSRDYSDLHFKKSRMDPTAFKPIKVPGKKYLVGSKTKTLRDIMKHYYRLSNKEHENETRFKLSDKHKEEMLDRHKKGKRGATLSQRWMNVNRSNSD